MSSRPNAMGPILALLILACLLPVRAAVADEPPVCLATEGQICTCDLTKLRPLQGALGMKQVTYMKNRIADHPQHARRRLEEDPIKVVAGVGGQLFIIDPPYCRSMVGSEDREGRERPLQGCQLRERT